MNLPNKLTIVRIIIVPFFVAVLMMPDIQHHYLWALLLFIIASVTDHFDGSIARKNNQITDFGKFMDPLADKVLVTSALVCFVSLNLVNVWFVILMITRDLMVNSIRLVAADSGKVIAANNWGKIKTVTQIVAIIAVLLFQYIGELTNMGWIPAFTIGEASSTFAFAYIGNVFMLIATFFSVLSGIIYLKQNIHFINTSK